MEDWTKFTDDQVFGGASEMPGSQASYWRDTEIRRRLYLLQRQSLEAQIGSTSAQRDAIAAQRDAIAEMKTQSRVLFWSVIGIFASAVVTLIAAFIK